MKRSNVPPQTPESRARRHETWRAIAAVDLQISRIFFAMLAVLFLAAVFLPIIFGYLSRP